MRVCLFVVVAAAALGQHRGDVPPALVWDKLTGNCPPSLDWATLRGRVVVVSVSGPHVLPSEIEEWSEVAPRFHAEPVVFIQIVTGSEFLVNETLKRTPYSGCVLFDSADANRRNFKLGDFTRTVLVDQLGVIAGYSRGGPDEAAIRAVLNLKSETGLAETPPAPQQYDIGGGIDVSPSYEVHISRAPRYKFRVLGQSGPDRYITTNQPLKLIVLDLWSMPMARIKFLDNVPVDNYDVVAHIPVADHAVLVKLVQDAIQKHFGLRIEKESRMERAYLMRVIPDAAPQLHPASDDDEWMSGGGEASTYGVAQSMRDVAREFENLLDVPVFDETGLRGKYNYSVASKLPDEELPFDLARQLGLELRETQRTVEMLVVRKVE